MTMTARLALAVAFVASVNGAPVALAQGAATAKQEFAATAQSRARYPSVDIHKRKLGWDKSHHVEYFDPRQREARRVVIHDGKVYKPDGTIYPDTKSSHKNQGNYVMDPAGNFYLFDEWTTPTVRHSSIFAGGPVAGAGNIQIAGGRIVYIDGESGHYPTGREHFANVMKELAADGVDVKTVHARP